MDADTRAKIEQGLRLARRIVPEYRLARAFAQQTKTAIRRAAEEKGLDLGLERVTLWRERGDRDFEHLGSTRTIYRRFTRPTIIRMRFLSSTRSAARRSHSLPVRPRKVDNSVGFVGPDH